MQFIAEEDIEVWIFPHDPVNIAQCFFTEDIEGDGVMINLSTQMEIRAVGSQTPSREMVARARQIVKDNLDFLMQKHDEMRQI